MNGLDSHRRKGPTDHHRAYSSIGYWNSDKSQIKKSTECAVIASHIFFLLFVDEIA